MMHDDIISGRYSSSSSILTKNVDDAICKQLVPSKNIFSHLADFKIQSVVRVSPMIRITVRHFLTNLIPGNFFTSTGGIVSDTIETIF